MPRLDVETDEQRRERLGTLFSSLSTPPSSTSDPLPMPSRPFAMPESDALARARAFLPLMAASNAELDARRERGEDVAIDVGLRKGEGQDEEGEDDGEGDEDAEGEDEDAEGEEDEEEGEGEAERTRNAHVEMDVGVGVFDVQGSVAGDVGPVVERDAEVWKGRGKGEERGE